MISTDPSHHRQPGRTTQLRLLHQPEAASVLVNGEAVCVRGVAAEMAEPLATDMALGLLTVIAEDAEGAVDRARLARIMIY